MIKKFSIFESNSFIPESFIEEQKEIETFCDDSREDLFELNKKLKEKLTYIINYWFSTEKDNIIILMMILNVG